MEKLSVYNTLSSTYTLAEIKVYKICIVNQELPSLHGGALETILTVLLRPKLRHVLK